MWRAGSVSIREARWMENTPISMRKHVTILGDTNVGKSTLFNSILGQDKSIVSEYRGTTTDPVIKAMELIPFGPIALIDTGGLDDVSQVGEERVKRALEIIDRTDLAIYATDIMSFDKKKYTEVVNRLNKKNIPHILVFTKCDKASKTLKKDLKDRYKKAVFTSKYDGDSITRLKNKMVEELKKMTSGEETLIGDLLPPNSTVIAVVSIDSGAPKGRLILPQVQFIRDCLDHGIKCLVTREDELKDAILELENVDLVVTDSQNFKKIDKLVPDNILLTSFSMLFARQKGNMDILLEGVEKVKSLPKNARVLIAEGCTHNTTHEDIGRVKIPKLLKKYTGVDIQFDFYGGHDFPEDISDYNMVIHCGGCMLNKKAVETRILKCISQDIPITNYGVLLAYLNGIIERSSRIFKI